MQYKNNQLKQDVLGDFKYPFVAGGQKFWLNKDPVAYAESVVEEYRAGEVKDAWSMIAWKDYARSFLNERETKTSDEIASEARHIVALDFVKDKDFLKFYMNDGGEIVPDFTVEVEEDALDEREELV